MRWPPFFVQMTRRAAAAEKFGVVTGRAALQVPMRVVTCFLLIARRNGSTINGTSGITGQLFVAT